MILQVELQLLGAIAHGMATYGFFFEGGQGMSKKNIVCGAIIYLINEWKEEKRELPDVLHLQLDNCAGDNKNHTMIGLCGHLCGLASLAMACSRRCRCGQFSLSWLVNSAFTTVSAAKSSKPVDELIL